MTFLAPLFLLGGLAVALPVIFHLIRRTTRERTIFSSLMFLLPTPPRLTRRSRLEHILLLLLRCAVLCLLALAFARPFIKTPAAQEPPNAVKRIVLLVDTSASMRRANLWADARQKAESILRQAAPADQLALFTFDRQVTPLITFEQWNAAPIGERAALAAGKLAETSPGWSATQLGYALINAAEALADTGGKPAPGPRQIVLISDLQEGSHVEPLQGYEWPKGLALTIEPVKARNQGNAAIQLVNEAEDADPKTGASRRVRISNSSDSKRDQFKVGWAEPDSRSFAGAPLDAYVPPGQSRILTLPSSPTNGAGDRILLRGDDEDFDNTVFAIPMETQRLTVFYFGAETEKDSKQPLYFLERALQDTRRQSVHVRACPPSQPFPVAEAPAASLFIATDAMPDALARELHEQIAAGKTLLFAPKNEAAAPALARLLALDRLELQDAPTNSYAMFADIDFRHPLFAPFADARFSDFTKIHFWRHRRIDPSAIPGARLLAKFDNGDPAFLEVPVGKGRVLLLASGWQPDDSQLALSTKFVPLLYSILELCGASVVRPAQYNVGDIVPLPSIPSEAIEGASAVSVRTPDGAQIPLPSGATNFSQTVAPGIYTVMAAPARELSRFAINLDGIESRTAPLAADELERSGAPIAHPLAPLASTARKVQLQNAELESRQKLWRWFIITTLALLLLETWLAGRTARRLTADVTTEFGAAN